MTCTAANTFCRLSCRFAAVLLVLAILAVDANGDQRVQANPEMGKSGRDYYGDPLPAGALVRMGSVRLRQDEARIAFSADGKTLIAVSPIGGVHFWDMKTGSEAPQPRIRMPKVPEWNARNGIVEVSPDGGLVTANFQESLLLFDTKTGEQRPRMVVGPDLPRSLGVVLHGATLNSERLVFSRDGKTLACRLWIKDHLTVRLWDLSTGKEKPAPPLQSFVGNITLSSDGKILALLDDKEGLRLWDTVHRRELRRVRTEREYLSFSPDGKAIVTWIPHVKATLWDTASLKKRATLKVSAGSSLSSGLVWSPDGALLAAAEDKEIILWDVAAGKERRRLPSREGQRLAFAPDGKTLACAGESTIELWDTGTGAPLHRRPGHATEVWSVAISPDGKLVASVARSSPYGRIWDSATGKPLPRTPKHEDVRCCTFSRDGKWLLSGGNADVRLWTAKGKEVRRFEMENIKGEREKGSILACHLSADGARVAALRASWDTKQNEDRNQIAIWDARTGKLLASRSVRGVRNLLSSCFSNDGDLVTVETRAGLVLEDTRTGQQQLELPGDMGGPVAFSSDDHLLVVGLHESQEWQGALSSYQSKGFRVVERATGEEFFHSEGWTDLAAFSPDGRRLATVDDSTLRLWGRVTGERLFQRTWPAELVRRPGRRRIGALSFLANGQAVMTGLGDGTLLVWDVPSAEKPKATTAKKLNREELDALWSDLGRDAPRAYRATPILAASPQQALPYLADHLQTVAVADLKRVEQLLSDLDSEQFAARETASRKLNQLGEQIEPALQRVLANKPSPEVHRRASAIQASLRAVPLETRRTLRAIRVLEHVGTLEARQVLEKLARGSPLARQTREAKRVLSRLPKD